MSFTFQFTPEAKRVLARHERLPRTMLGVIARTCDEQNELTVSHIVEHRLSQRGPETLGVVTSRLRRSIRRTNARIVREDVVSSIGSNVVYLGVHEFGFSGDQQVRAHVRKVQSRNVGKSGKVGVRKASAVALGVAFVKAHQRHMEIPARAPIRRGIADRQEEYGEALSSAIVGEASGA